MSCRRVKDLRLRYPFQKEPLLVLEPVEVISFTDTYWGKIVAATITVVVFLLVILWYILLPLYIVYAWWRYGRDPVSVVGVTSAWFDVPKTKTLRRLAPAEVGTVIDESADMRDITATLVYLAREGYLKIIEKKKNDFTLIRLKNKKEEDLQVFEKKLLNGIFDTSDEVRVKDKDLSNVVSGVKTAIYDAVVKEGYFQKNPETVRTLYTILAVFGFMTGNMLLAITAFIFGRAMPRKTLPGVEVSNIAKSLKNFLVSQEHRLAYEARNQIFFEKFLPYAVAFGVEKIWAERFKDIAMTQPGWYEGQNTRMFNSVVFASALNSSLTSFSHAATPTRSTSGYSSGFSGGFSGGGGGGGGGGSW